MPGFLAVAQQERAQVGGDNSGDRDPPVCPPPDSLPSPREGGWQSRSLCWRERRSREFPRSSPSPLARERGRAAERPRVRGATGLGDARPPWWGAGPQGAACTFLPPDAKAQIGSSLLARLLLGGYSAFTQAVLAPSVAGEGVAWGSPRGSAPRSLPSPELRKNSPGRASGI